VFELEDSQSDRQIVQIFSKDSDGNERLVTTVLAIPDYITKTPDKPIINFEERSAGTPEAVHNWFYPGDNAGWAFVYPKGQNLDASANTTPAPAPVTTAAAPSLPSTPEVQEQAPAPQVQEQEPAPKAAAVDEEVIIAQNDAPALDPTPDADTQGSADRTLPQTAGDSGLELLTGLAMLGGGIAAVFASRRKSLA
jgi:hypothetical protein